VRPYIAREILAKKTRIYGIAIQSGPRGRFFICWKYQRNLEAVRMWVFLMHSTKR
jgi:hypothetical protein